MGTLIGDSEPVDSLTWDLTTGAIRTGRWPGAEVCLGGRLAFCAAPRSILDGLPSSPRWRSDFDPEPADRCCCKRESMKRAGKVLLSIALVWLWGTSSA